MVRFVFEKIIVQLTAQH